MSKLKSILVTGCSGQLGLSIQSIAADFTEFEFVFVNRQGLDLSDEISVARFFENQTFDIIINCAAFTSVDRAESESELVYQINHLAVQRLAKIVKKHRSKLIHISSDYVFSGEQYRPYLETDEAQPIGVYGKSKLRCERDIQNILKSNAIIIRTSWIYSEYGNNFVKTMLKLGKERDALNVIFDQVGTPTYAKDLAKAIMCIIKSRAFSRTSYKTDIFNYSNEGVCSWYDFAKTIFELRNIQCRVLPVEAKDYPTAARRPHYSVLNKAKIKKNFDVTIPYWKDSVRLCLTALRKGES